MQKLKVYLDTLVISYLDQQDAPEKMRETHQLWNLIIDRRYEVFISNVVIQEIDACTPEKRAVLYSYLDQITYTVLEASEKSVELAEKMIDFGILKEKSFGDCQHIAAAILGGCDIITSWNFKHIVNVKTSADNNRGVSRPADIPAKCFAGKRGL